MDTVPAAKTNQNILRVMAYAAERFDRALPDKITTRTFEIEFEPYNSSKRFTDYDGLLVFQGTFEHYEKITPRQYSYIGPTHKVFVDHDNLDKREKELDALLQNKGFACFILHRPFADQDMGASFTNTDLAKRFLNWDRLYRQDLRQRLTDVRAKLNDFHDFLKIYGAASSHFTNHNPNLKFRELATTPGGDIVGISLHDKIFFLPSLLPEIDRLNEYYTVLCRSAISAWRKCSVDLPEWVGRFAFPEEPVLRAELDQISTRIQEISAKREEYNVFKRSLVCDGDRLVESVRAIFRTGFRWKLDDTDEYREDFSIISDGGEPVALIEVKGTNKGVKREFVNQADSHRERANLTANFPTLLVLNTHLKTARSWDVKQAAVPSEHVAHAKKINVLILRTVDLIELLRMCLDQKLSRDDVLEMFTKTAGWLRVEAGEISIE